MATPLWLGLILVVLGYAANILTKWVDLKTNGEEPFSMKFWWETNYLNVALSFVFIALLLLIFPETPELFKVQGSEELGARATYAMIGYMPYKFFKAIIPKKK